MLSNIRFDYNGISFTSNASVLLKKFNKVYWFKAIADTGCTHTAMNLTDLLTLLNVSFDDFKKIYHDFDATSYTSYVTTGNGVSVRTKRICIPNLKLGFGVQTLPIPEFYCELMLPSFNSNVYSDKLYDIKPNHKSIKPKVFIGNDIITSCQSFTFYENHAYMSGFDYDKYLDKAKSKTNIVYNFYNIE